MHFVYTGSLLLVPLSYAELPLGIQIKNSNDQKIESARGKMGGGERPLFSSFHIISFPHIFLFSLSPISIPPYDTTRSLWGRDREQSEHEINGGPKAVP